MPGARVWGIDLGRSALKAVRVGVRRGEIEILAADVIPYEGEGRAGEEPGRDRRMWKALAAFQERNRIGGDKVVISVPGQATFIRNLKIILVGKKSLSELVQFEAQQEIPFVLDEVIWDYELFEPEDKNAKQREGVLFAVKKNVLNNYYLSLSSANVHADVVQTTPLALYNFFCYDQGTGRGYLVLDVGSEGSELVAINGRHFWTRSLPVGGNKVTEALAQEFELPSDKADAAKRLLESSKYSSQYLEVIRPALQSLASEVQKSLAYHKSQGKDLSFEVVYLMGSGARTLGLREQLAQSLGKDVVVFAKFGRMTVSKKANLDVIAAHLPALGVALGLAVQGAGQGVTDVNLIPQRAARRSIVSKKKPYVGAIAAAILVFLGAMFYFLREENLRLRQMNSALLQLRDQVETAESQFKAATDVKEVMQKLDAAVTVGDTRPPWLNVLSEIAKTLPNNTLESTPDDERVWLISLSLDTADAPPVGRVIRVNLEGGIVQKGGYVRAVEQFKKLVETPITGNPAFLNFRRLSAITSSELALKEDATARPTEGQRSYYVFGVTWDVKM